MSYLTIGLVGAPVVLAVLILAVTVLRLMATRRRMGDASKLAGTALTERIGVLGARIAALRVEMARRRKPPWRRGVGSTRTKTRGAPT